MSADQVRRWTSRAPLLATRGQKALARLTPQISLPGEGPVTTLEVPEVIAASVPHKNKYGEDYPQYRGYEPK